MKNIIILLLTFFLLGIQSPQIQLIEGNVSFSFFPKIYAGQAIPLASQQKKALKIKQLVLKYMQQFDDEELIAAVLAFFLGFLGAHKFYQGKRGGGIAILGLFLGGLLLFLGGYVLFIIGGVTFNEMWWIGTGLAWVLGTFCMIAAVIWGFIDFIRIIANMT